MVTSVSIYSGAERAICQELLELFGSSFTKKLTRRNTHLICRGSDGPKYKKAIEWGLTIATIEWLFECASSGYYIAPNDIGSNAREENTETKENEQRSRQSRHQKQLGYMTQRKWMKKRLLSRMLHHLLVTSCFQ